MVGRQRDLARLSTAFDEALSGHGSVWLVTGEAGIGKTHLLEQTAAWAAPRGAVCLWGRCWEGGGAPSYWPWIQVLRDAFEQVPEARSKLGSKTRWLASLVPEWAVSDDSASDRSVEPFQLYDAVTESLKATARITPCLILLEDLHVADSASIALLDFVARQVDHAPILVVGTYRDRGVFQALKDDGLGRLARRTHTMTLGRLERADVADMLTGLDPDTVERVFLASEGNPLFVVEVARVLGRASGDHQLPLSEGIRSVIREHLNMVPDEVIECLREASVLGREVDPEVLVELAGRSADQVHRHVRSGVEAGLLTTMGTSTFRFSHFLIREVLHAELDPERRAALHRTAAERLMALPRPPWAQILMHDLQAGPGARGQARVAARRAGDEAMAQLAYGNAVEFYGQALDLLPEEDQTSERVELLLDRARGQLIQGALEEGKSSCVRAAELAASLDRPDLYARAALELGGIFIIGHVDATMVHLLQEALNRLGEQPSALRAQVMARYAAAIQPAEDLSQPVRMALDAIDMARRLDDPKALLQTLRSSVSAMMDVWDPVERRRLNEEHVRLAESLGDRAEMLRGYQRLCIDTLEVGDMEAHRAAARAADRIAEGLGHPYFQWRTALILAADAAITGRFAESDAHLERGRRLAQTSGDPGVELTLAMQAVGMGLVREDDARTRAGMDALLNVSRQVQLDAAFGTLQVAGALARMEAQDDARTLVVERDVQVALQYRDVGSLMMLADVACLHQDRALARRLEPALRACPQVLVSWGLVGLTCDGPVARARGLVAGLLDRKQEAEAHFQTALQVAERAGLGPCRARILYDLARCTEQREYADAARKMAASLSMPGLLRRIEARFGHFSSKDASIDPAAPPRFEMRLQAGLWQVATPRGDFHLKRTRGADILARLVQAPGQEHHVLDLMGASAGSSASGARGSDGGPMLDARAKAEYQARLRELQAELEEAESWTDTGRAERVRAEQDALMAELSRAFGLGGKPRAAGSDSERARVNVQRRLKDAIRRIAEHDAETGRWLERSVVTGTYCRFDPP